MIYLLFYLQFGTIVYGLLTYAEFKLEKKTPAQKKLSFLNLLIGMILTLTLWPIALILAFFVRREKDEQI